MKTENIHIEFDIILDKFNAMIPLNWKILTLDLIFAGKVDADVEWGIYGHKKINRLAVFTLPVEMIDFYKLNIS